MVILSSRQLAAALTVAAIVCAAVRWLEASAYVITPVRVTLSRDAPTSTVTLRNDEDVPLRVQISMFRWSPGSEGKEMVLDPTDDLVFFPTLLAVEAGETRTIRVSTKRHAEDTEIAYRMLVEELPPVDTQGRTGVTVLTRVSLPIFVAPSKPAARLQVDRPRHEQGRLVVPVLNRGNVHVMVDTVHIAGVTRAGDQIFEREITGWYVLPGENRLFETESLDCTGADSLAVTVKAGALTETVEAAPDAVGCQD